MVLGYSCVGKGGNNESFYPMRSMDPKDTAGFLPCSILINIGVVYTRLAYRLARLPLCIRSRSAHIGLRGNTPYSLGAFVWTPPLRPYERLCHMLSNM